MIIRYPAIILSLLLSAILAISCREKVQHKKSVPLYTNEQYVNGLFARISIDSPKEVFNYIFQSLPDEVTVYPSENVYYFRTTLLGKIYDGTITLYPRDRDSGRLGFGYVNRMEHRTMQKYFQMTGGSYDFEEKDGMDIKKINNNEYNVSYKNKDVLFKLHVLADTAPSSLKLLPSEEWVASTFDESGLQFHLLFSKKTNHLFWVLNESVFVSESFHPVSPHLFIGDRTEFIFFNDTARKRKILVGVNGENVMQNNWYDGPFDHLADNRIHEGKLNLKPYLEKHYPDYIGKIDNYGHFISKKGSRVALAPYMVYFSLQDLAFIEKEWKAGGDEDQLFLVMTQQQYDVPKDYYNFKNTFIKLEEEKSK